MKKMSIQFSLYLALCSFLISTSPSIALDTMKSTPAQASQQGMPANDQDFAKMMQELEQATKEMDTFVKSLPPEEQAEFNKVVQQVEKKMLDMDPAVLEKFLTNQMNPEEMDQFLGGVFEGIEPAAAPETKEPVVEEKPKKEKKKKEKPVKKEATKQEQAIELINNLVKTTDSVILKIQAVPELSLKIKRWGKKGVIYDWPKDGSWDKTKAEIESLRQDINKLLDKESGKDKFKYLDAFVENESLYNNVAKLNTTLGEYEPKIKTSGVGIDKITKDTKTAIKRAISGFTESLYRIKLPAELKKVFDTFEPKATKMREKEEESKKKQKPNPESLAYLPQR
jgi:hypothetical protein